MDALQEFVAEAKKNKYSAIPKLSDDDIVSVWDNVSAFVERHMSMLKGVHIPGIGTFTFSQKKLDIGNNKFVLMQRPVFVLSEKFAQTHGLQNPKHFTSGQIPIVQLNFSALSSESPFDRDTVEGCVKEVIQAFSRAVQAKRNVEFSFSGIGRLLIREGKVKMKFFKDFMNMMDGSGQLTEALRNRPDTTDSVISRASSIPRPGTSNTLVLPRITQGKEGFSPEGETDKRPESMPAIHEEERNTPAEECPTVDQEPIEVQELDEEEDKNEDDEEGPQDPAPSQPGLPTATFVGIDADDLKVTTPPKGIRGNAMTPSPTNSKPASPSGQLPPPKSPFTLKPPTPPHIAQSKSRHSAPASSCGHGAGQELCYLCHQRAVNNVPVSFDVERRKKEQEQDRLLQQYQHMKDTESIIREQAQNLSNRHHSQKIAAFNLGVSEAVKSKRKERPTSFHRSYIFQSRPLTPPRIFMQDEYASYLAGQVESKQAAKNKQKSDKDFLERLEQVQLAEELAAQREQYLRNKAAQTEMYQRALSAQVRIRDMIQQSLEAEDVKMDAFNHHANPINAVDSREGTPRTCRQLDPLTLPVPKIIIPFSQTEPIRFRTPDQRMVRFKPLPLPAALPDSKEPIFGKYDATNEQLADKRRRAIKVYQEQLKAVDQSEKMKLLKHLKHQREETDMLERTRQELIADRAERFEHAFTTRKGLEEHWKEADRLKKINEDGLRLGRQSPGILLHEQCDQYDRCGQCQRRVTNCGESNIWSESRYISGSQLIV